ncbi:hypothetical protein ACAG39_02040 [Caldicellulosiruptoraceae bacterium PP1]
MNKLYFILEPYDDWKNDVPEEKNQEAKKALVIFYNELKKYKPSKIYEQRNSMLLHTSYILHFVNIKKAFMEKKYLRVCNEIRTLMFNEPFLQARIYYNLIKLLREELMDNKGEE